MPLTWNRRSLRVEGTHEVPREVSQVPTSRAAVPGGVVGVRALREDTSAVVAAVERGDWFLVSKRGRPVGVLLPSAMAEELLIEHAAEIIALQLNPTRRRGVAEHPTDHERSRSPRSSRRLTARESRSRRAEP